MAFFIELYYQSLHDEGKKEYSKRSGRVVRPIERLHVLYTFCFQTYQSKHFKTSAWEKYLQS